MENCLSFGTSNNYDGPMVEHCPKNVLEFKTQQGFFGNNCLLTKELKKYN
jgi:hypothetical protein